MQRIASRNAVEVNLNTNVARVKQLNIEMGPVVFWNTKYQLFPDFILKASEKEDQDFTPFKWKIRTIGTAFQKSRPIRILRTRSIPTETREKRERIKRSRYTIMLEETERNNDLEKRRTD